jgi:hypothetical protein
MNSYCHNMSTSKIILAAIIKTLTVILNAVKDLKPTP